MPVATPRFDTLGVSEADPSQIRRSAVVPYPMYYAALKALVGLAE
jgi:hypothetical protein